MLNATDLDYELPESAIARTAADPRDTARLLVVKRSDPAFMAHQSVRDLPAWLAANDLLVINSTRVLPARLIGYRADTRGAVEGLFLGLTPGGADERHWNVLLRGRRMKPGITINLVSEEGAETGVRLALVEQEEAAEGEGAVPWRAHVYGANDSTTAAAILDRVGRTPLPPYILAARKRHEDHISDSVDRDRYQCVYAGPSAGSVAAPTAGLHFTPALLRSLSDMGVQRAEVTLHVGTGTFKPIECPVVEDHPMHAEWCSVPAATGEAIDRARGVHGRVIAVGTTRARTRHRRGDHVRPHPGELRPSRAARRR